MPWMPERPRKKVQDRRARWVGYSSQRWRKLRAIILAQQPLCVECDKIATVVDHIVSVRSGGDPWSLSNLQSMCSRCHDSKSGREAHASRTYTR